MRSSTQALDLSRIALTTPMYAIKDQMEINPPIEAAHIPLIEVGTPLLDNPPPALQQNSVDFLLCHWPYISSIIKSLFFLWPAGKILTPGYWLKELIVTTWLPIATLILHSANRSYSAIALYIASFLLSAMIKSWADIGIDITLTIMTFLIGYGLKSLVNKGYLGSFHSTCSRRLIAIGITELSSFLSWFGYSFAYSTFYNPNQTLGNKTDTNINNLIDPKATAAKSELANSAPQTSYCAKKLNGISNYFAETANMLLYVCGMRVHIPIFVSHSTHNLIQAQRHNVLTMQRNLILSGTKNTQLLTEYTTARNELYSSLNWYQAKQMRHDELLNVATYKPYAQAELTLIEPVLMEFLKKAIDGTDISDIGTLEMIPGRSKITANSGNPKVEIVVKTDSLPSCDPHAKISFTPKVNSEGILSIRNLQIDPSLRGGLRCTPVNIALKTVIPILRGTITDHINDRLSRLTGNHLLTNSFQKYSRAHPECSISIENCQLANINAAWKDNALKFHTDIHADIRLDWQYSCGLLSNAGTTKFSYKNGAIMVEINGIPSLEITPDLDPELGRIASNLKISIPHNFFKTIRTRTGLFLKNPSVNQIFSKAVDKISAEPHIKIKHNQTKIHIHNLKTSEQGIQATLKINNQPDLEDRRELCSKSGCKL